MKIVILPLFYDYLSTNKVHYDGFFGNHYNIDFVSGCGFVLSRDACSYLVEHSDSPHSYLPDDVLIGLILTPIFGRQYIGRQYIGRNDITSLDNICYNNIVHCVEVDRCLKRSTDK